MVISSFMANDLAALQHTLQLSLLNKQITDGAATAVEMVSDMLPATQHPTLGQHIDVKA